LSPQSIQASELQEGAHAETAAAARQNTDISILFPFGFPRHIPFQTTPNFDHVKAFGL
jgi:hypothetical protein